VFILFHSASDKHTSGSTIRCVMLHQYFFAILMHKVYHMKEHQQWIWLRPALPQVFYCFNWRNCIVEHKTWNYSTPVTYKSLKLKVLHPPSMPHSTQFEKDLFGFPPPLISRSNMHSFITTQISHCSVKYKQLLTCTACYMHVELTPNFVKF